MALHGIFKIKCIRIMLINSAFNSIKGRISFLLCNLKPQSPVPSSAYCMSLAVNFCIVLPASALITAEVLGVRTPLAPLISSSLDVYSCLSGLAALMVWRTVKVILASVATCGIQFSRPG